MAEITVYDFNQLKAAIVDAVSTYIILGNDIVFTSGGGVIVPRTKGDITIDGMGYMITDYATTNSGDTIRFETTAGADVTLTFKNIVWNGRNYYGVGYVGESANCSGITLVLENIDYTGPQAIHNRFGITRILDSRFSIEKNGSPSSVQELGEVNRLFIEGRVTVDKVEANAVLWFLNTGAALVVEEGAEFIVNAPSTYMFYVDGVLPTMTFRSNSRTEILTSIGLYLYASATLHMAESFTLEPNASFSAVQTASSTVPSFKCNGNFYLGEGSSFLVAVPPSNTGTLMYFASVASLTFDNPKSVVLYTNGGKVFSFRTGSAASPNTISITAELLNMWLNASPYMAAGDFEDTPSRAIAKADYSDITATITTTNAAISGMTTNIQDGDSGYPVNSSTFNILNARVLSMGRLTVNLDEINDAIDSITGSTEPQANLRANFLTQNLTGISDSSGGFSLQLADRIPPGTNVSFGTNWKFLTKWLTIESKGSVQITHLEELKFRGFVAPYHASTVKREQTTWYVEVTDTRLEDTGDWLLFASLPEPLKIPEEELSDALVLRENRAIEILSPTPTLIRTGSWQSPPPIVTQISWLEIEGFFLSVDPEHAYPPGKYTSSMKWEIEIDES